MPVLSINTDLSLKSELREFSCCEYESVTQKPNCWKEKKNLDDLEKKSESMVVFSRTKIFSSQRVKFLALYFFSSMTLKKSMSKFCNRIFRKKMFSLQFVKFLALSTKRNIRDDLDLSGDHDLWPTVMRPNRGHPSVLYLSSPKIWTKSVQRSWRSSGTLGYS